MFNDLNVNHKHLTDTQSPKEGQESGMEMFVVFLGIVGAGRDKKGIHNLEKVKPKKQFDWPQGICWFQLKSTFKTWIQRDSLGHRSWTRGPEVNIHGNQAVSEVADVQNRQLASQSSLLSSVSISTS